MVVSSVLLFPRIFFLEVSVIVRVPRSRIALSSFFLREFLEALAARLFRVSGRGLIVHASIQERIARRSPRGCLFPSRDSKEV